MFPNQLLSALIRGNRLYLPNIGAQPEPPEIFNANVQALVYAVDTDALAEVAAEHVNLNQQIAVETAAPPPSLDRTFGNDIVAIDANLAGDTFLIVSRGGNQVFRAKLDPATGQLNILNAAGTRVDCRIQTGNLPSGVAMRQDGTRGYANNEANFSVTSMNIDDGFCLTLQLDIPSSEPPAPGSFEHAVLVGKLAFFTALGIPDNDIFGTPIRDIIPRNFKGKQSKDAWSSCGSCHPDGLADGVTWIFGTGPRQTKPLDGMFTKAPTRMTRASSTGAPSAAATPTSTPTPVPPRGAAASPAMISTPGNVSTNGNSDAGEPRHLRPRHHARGQRRPRRADLVDLCRRAAAESAAAQRCWRPGGRSLRPIVPPATGEPSGRRARSSTATTPPPSPRTGRPWTPASPGSRRRRRWQHLANEFFSFTCNDLTIKYLEDVGTFDVTNPLEIRDNATASTAFGVNGFNVPSLLSINYHAPYLHRGQAQTLEEVFPLHRTGPRRAAFPPTTTIQTQLTAAAGGSAGVPEIDRWHHRPLPLRGG